MQDKSNLMAVITDQELNDLAARNEERLHTVKIQLGKKYLLHPDNQITKKKYRQELKKQRKVFL
jgi:hypothetical protein